MKRLGPILLAGAGVLLAASLLGMCGRVADRGRFAVAHSTHSAGPDGSRALFLLAEAEGLKTYRWSRDLLGLPQDGILVALGDCRSKRYQKLSRFEETSLLDFVRGGGTLLIAGAPGLVLDEFPVSLRQSSRCRQVSAWLRDVMGADGEDKNTAAEQESSEPLSPFGEREVDSVVARGEGVLDGLERVSLENPGTLLLEPDVDAKVLLREGDSLHGVQVAFESGEVIVLSSASLFQNQNLEPAAGGLVFGRLLRRAQTGTAYFDELHLGVGQHRSMIQYFRSIGGGWVALQCLFVLALAFWRVSLAFGTPKVVSAPRPGGTRPFLTALGSLYGRSGDLAAVLKRLQQHALHRVAAAHHMEFASAARLIAVLEERQRTVQAGAVEQIRTLSVRRDAGARGLLVCAQRLERLVAEACVGTDAGAGGASEQHVRHVNGGPGKISPAPRSKPQEEAV